ncbi:MAG: hypothetical protein ABJN26_20610 [Stappiaceae bacterium]
MTGEGKQMDRDEAELLLPFYVNGTLEVEVREEFEAVLAKNDELRIQLELAQEDREFVTAENEAITIPSPAKFNQLLGENTGSRPRANPSVVTRILTWWEGLPPIASAGVAVAALVLVLLQASIIAGGLLNQPTGNGFRTASGEDKPSVTQNAGAFAGVVVRFADSATAARISDLMTRIDAEIVSGPRAGGLYHVKLNKPFETAEEFDTFIKELNTNSTIILFAQKAS